MPPQYRDAAGRYAPEPGIDVGSALLGGTVALWLVGLGAAIYQGTRQSLPAAPSRPAPLLRAPAPPASTASTTAPPPTQGRTFASLVPFNAPPAAPTSAPPTPTPSTAAPLITPDALKEIADLLARLHPQPAGAGGDVPSTPSPNTGVAQRVAKLVNMAADERTPENERRNAGVAAAVAIQKNGLKVVPDGQA